MVWKPETGGNPIATLAQNSTQFSYGVGGLTTDVYSHDDFVDMRRTTRRGNRRRSESTLPRVRDYKPRKPWVSPPELGGTEFDVETVVRYQFSRPQSINFLAFEVANVPCNWTVWTLDEGQGDFIPMTDREGSPVKGRLLGQKTEISTGRTQQSSLDEFLNPDAVGLGNFVPFEFVLPKVSTTAIEFRMDRKIATELLPRYFADGTIKVAYSLAIRGLRFTHLLEREEDLPLDDEDVLFTDPLGGRQRLQKNFQSSHYASDRDLDEDWQTTFWQSGPQPIAGAVVPLYLDISNPDTGDAVVVDRLSTVPLWPGPHFNVYYSTDDKVGDFFLSNKTADMNLLGAAVQQRTFGLICNSTDARAEVDATPMRFDLRQDWAIGCVYVPAYASSEAISNSRYLWEFKLKDTGRLALRYDPVSSPDTNGRFVLVQRKASGTEAAVYTSPPIAFTSGDSLAVVVGYNYSDVDPGYWFHTDIVAPAAADEPEEETRRWEVALTGFDSGDEFSLQWGEEVVGPFEYDASGSTTASAIQTALCALDDVGAGNATVNSSSDSAFTVQFGAGLDPSVLFELLVVDASGCTGTATFDPLEDGEVFDNLVPMSGGERVHPGFAALPDVLAVGNRVGGSTGTKRSAAGAIRQFWVRQDAFVPPTNGSGYVRSFSNRPYNFVNGVGPKDRSNGFYRCVFKASFWKDTTARFGPGAGWFDAKEWVPIPRDYILRNGIHQLPTTVAKFIKLEFYNLVPQPYEVSELRAMSETGVQMDFYYWPRTVIEYHKRMFPREKKPQLNPRNSSGYDYTYPVFKDDDRRAWFASQQRRGLRRAGDAKTRNALATEDQRFDAEKVIFQSGYLPPTMYRAWAKGDPINQRELVDALEFAAVPKSFHLAGPHAYETEVVTVANNEAFFVGLKDVSVYRATLTLKEDTPEYIDLLKDASLLDLAESNNYEFLEDGGLRFTARRGQFQTKSLQSISMVRTIQLAARQSDWDTTLSDGQISLVTSDHLNVLTGTTQSSVTGAYGGSGVGNLLQYTPTTAGTTYGVKTKSGLFDARTIGGVNPDAYYDSDLPYDDSVSYDDVTRFYDLSGARTSAVVRFYLPDTAEGSYELRLYSVIDTTQTLVAKTAFSPLAREWGEYEVAYMSKPGETNWVAEVIQTDTTVSEPFVIDMLGIWQNPIRWEVSNDDGATWQPVLLPLNDPEGFISFPTQDRRLRVRAVALRSDVSVYAWHLVPWYLESPVARRVPMDYAPPWGVSDRQDLRAVIHRPMFQGWLGTFPQRYSIYQLGTVPSSGQGFTP